MAGDAPEPRSASPGARFMFTQDMSMALSGLKYGAVKLSKNLKTAKTQTKQAKPHRAPVGILLTITKSFAVSYSREEHVKHGTG